MSIVLFFFICVNYFCKENEKNFCFTQKILDGRYAFLYNRKNNGVIAQLVARLNGIQKVRGSTPLSSTKIIGRYLRLPIIFIDDLLRGVEGWSRFRESKTLCRPSIPPTTINAHGKGRH